MSEMSFGNMALDMAIGLAIATVLLVLLTKARRNPFEVHELDDYQTAYGEGPVTVTPEMPSDWITWDCSDSFPPGVRMHTRVQVRYVDGRTSDEAYAAAFYWGRYARYPAHGSHIAAYRIVNN